MCPSIQTRSIITEIDFNTFTNIPTRVLLRQPGGPTAPRPDKRALIGWPTVSPRADSTSGAADELCADLVAAEAGLSHVQL